MLPRRFLFGAISLLMAACSPVSHTASGSHVGRHPWTHPDVLRIAMTGSPNTLNPLLSTQQFETQAEALALDPLVATDPEGHDVPILADRVPTLENGGISKDGLSITYRLRRGVVWQDGAPFSSHDVAFTWRALMNPQSAIATRHGYDDVSRVDTPDAATAIFHLKRRFAPAVHTFFAHSDAVMDILPAHLLERYASLDNLPYNSRPVGTGPYRIVRWLRGDRIEYVRNDRYFLGRPKIARIVLHLVPDENTIVEQMRSHEIDWFVQATPRVYPQLRGIPNVSVALVPFNGYYGIQFNAARAPWSDLRLRRAVGLALDKPELVQKITYGTTVAATEDLPSFMWASDPRAGTTKPNVAASESILDAAGWRPGADGTRVRGGRRLTLGLAYRSDSVTDRNAGVVIASMLRPAGIDVELKSYTTALFYGPFSENGILASGHYEAGLLTWYAGVDPDDSSQLVCDQRPPAGYNWSRYCTPAMDAAQRSALTQYDRPSRRRAYSQIQRLLARDNPYVYLWWPRQIEAVNDDLHAFRPNGLVEDWNAYQWSL